MKNKLLGDQIEKIKRDMKTAYLAGESVPSIAGRHNITERAVYYHISPLTADDKALHIKNSALRGQAIKQHTRKEEQHDGSQEQSAESTTETPRSSLSDFIE